MKKTIFLLICILYVSSNLAGQVTEPDFIGEVLLLHPDNSTHQLEKSTVQTKTKASASMYIVGIGNVKTKINVDGARAKVRVAKNEDFKLIVRAVDNQTDPMSIINIFKFDVKKKDRRAEVSSLGTFSGSSQNNLDLLSFQAQKYGESSYLVTLTEKVEGEYGIIVKNPNALDERNIIVASFAIE